MSRSIRCWCAAIVAVWACAVEAAHADVLFQGGFADAAKRELWSQRIGKFVGDEHMLRPEVILAVAPPSEPPRPGEAPAPHHVEAQLSAIIGTDFDYAADLVVPSGAEAHLQFRLSDQGRYGVAVGPGRFVIYRFQRLPYLRMTPSRPCDARNAAGTTHCPEWSGKRTHEVVEEETQAHRAVNWTATDEPVYQQIEQEIGAACAPPSRDDTARVHLSVAVRGASVVVRLNGATCRATLPNPVMRVGRFAVYAYGSASALPSVVFRDVTAVSDPTQQTNFALLYSTVGYEARGVKRALVRTVNSLNRPVRARYTLTRVDGTAVKWGRLPRVVKKGQLRSLRNRSFGMQLWEADFTDVRLPGTYRLHVTLTITGLRVGKPAVSRQVESAAFEIRPRLVSDRLLRRLSVLNAEARRGANEDFWRNWIIQSGAWRVGVDGAFIVERADASGGALLSRVFNIDNTPLIQSGAADFRLVGRLTVVNGCDAQLRFEDTAGIWWAVTLQVGGAGCPATPPFGAVRLSQEGRDVPNGFEAVATKRFDEPGRVRHGVPYDVEITAIFDTINVFVNRTQGALYPPDLERHGVPPRTGRFALKAWASTARFEDVQAWPWATPFVPRSPGSTRIPTFANNDHEAYGHVPCQFKPHPLDCPDGKCRAPLDEDEVNRNCYPFFAQLHGFHDANSNVAEGTSHGAFLAGLMQAWVRRAADLSAADRERLRDAIMTNVLYLEILLRQSGTTGQFAHSEAGRVNVDVSGLANTEYGLYGLSHFAADGQDVDLALANRACGEATLSAQWLWRGAPPPIAGSIVYTRLARCHERQRLDAATLWKTALNLATEVVEHFTTVEGSTVEGFRDQDRTWSRIVPWFEGVYELTRFRNGDMARFRGELAKIADRLLRYATVGHPCSDTDDPKSTACGPNGFEVVPQSSGGATIAHNWYRTDVVPKSEQRCDPIGQFGCDGAGWYNVNGHFPTSALDAIYLAILGNKPELARLAAGNLYWGLGLNPGVPAIKIARPVADGTVWQAASFVRGNDGPFARGHEGFRTTSYASKGWLDAWEGGYDAVEREAWRIDPQDRTNLPETRSFATFVNGHVISDGEWDYRNSGENGWVSGETFIMNDGAFLKAALLYEDWVAGNLNTRAPYDTRRLAFFDTSHVDRELADWGFDDPDLVPVARAARDAHEFCSRKGFLGGRFTGHVVGERQGVLCMPTTGNYFDVPTPFQEVPWDIDVEPWPALARRGTAACRGRGFPHGFFNGHQLNGNHGLICLSADTAPASPPATDAELKASRFPFVSLDTVSHAHAARAATNICRSRRNASGSPPYAGGYFNGTGRELVCLVQ